MNQKTYKLIRRCHRIYKRLDASRGTQMNLKWLHWMSVLMDAFDELEKLGVDTEDHPLLEQDNQFMLNTLEIDHA